MELRKIRHDRTELYTRAIQPALWLLIYGEVFTRVHAIPTPPGSPTWPTSSPGIIAQSALFIAIFYGIQIIWERDAGVLTKLMVTPTPRSALITGKAFASGVRSVIQGVVVVIIAALLGVSFTDNPLKLIAALVVLALGSAFFSCLSMSTRRRGRGPRPSDGHRPGDHDAALLQLLRALPGGDHAGLAAGDQQDQPAQLTRSRRCAGCSSAPRPPCGLTSWSWPAPRSRPSPALPSSSPASPTAEQVRASCSASNFGLELRRSQDKLVGGNAVPGPAGSACIGSADICPVIGHETPHGIGLGSRAVIRGSKAANSAPFLTHDHGYIPIWGK